MFIRIVKKPTGIRFDTTMYESDRKMIVEWYDFETTITLKLFKWEKTWVINRDRRLEQKGVRYEKG